MTANEKLFPIMGGPAIPWRLLAPHERQAEINHSQSLATLASRGGLSPDEALAVLADRRHFEMWEHMRGNWTDENKAEVRDQLIEVVRVADAQPEIDRLTTERDEARRELTHWQNAVNETACVVGCLDKVYAHIKAAGGATP
jgi:hypothetical protein